MACRICIELGQYLEAAQQPVSEGLIAGLTNVGMRNFIHQRQEKILKLTADLERHRKSCLHA
jgi:hypothetical protein